ncbi:tRNA (adenosine(37)-N6)-threonylcarbamoyltransferase complex ATPase subunit type 1 TsaE [Candidatus Shapirobacteria bacterium]|nr:tRNA (adenosine(37)-N6)-threonylcarbamoyltransferase complex ATPase subunit type 1 TsaE [Candidatus Shapirobacteria bacterium]
MKEEVAIITTNSAFATRQLGKKLVNQKLKQLKNYCLIFALQGELGSGKTQFVKGLGQALKIKRIIRSPTFTLVHEYPFTHPAGPRGILYHVDAWRLDNPQELIDLQLIKMIKPGNIIAIEWADKVKNALSKITKDKKVKIIRVKFKHLTPEQRKIKITHEN